MMTSFHCSVGGEVRLRAAVHAFFPRSTKAWRRWWPRLIDCIQLLTTDGHLLYLPTHGAYSTLHVCFSVIKIVNCSLSRLAATRALARPPPGELLIRCRLLAQTCRRIEGRASAAFSHMMPDQSDLPTRVPACC
eukprot:COSAG06_NODE_322_length_17565_cov_152.607752_14_plen_134_part_00